MLRVNGLFGWIRANDQRSLMLFGGFVAALQLAAALLLYIPLAGFDEAHAPFLNWGGYAIRYVPLVALVGAGVFAVQMLWHVHSVRRVLPFAFVDHQDERRLCDIVEQLAIGIGLPAPYVGVIESPAMNAFACGVRRSDAVVVVTRGLINGLDDEELAAVVAHELAHIANGDIRLIAAANVCLGMLRRLMLPKTAKKTHPLMELISLPVILFVMPPLFVAVLIAAFLAQCALRAGHLVRATISASREYIADGSAIEATQNPAALVSALRRIDGRSRIAGLAPGQDAMMIDGAATGAFATHPTIAERIKAVIAVTGSMAVIAPSRRDTRPARTAEAAPARASFGQRAAAAPAPEPEPASASRADTGDGRNWLGLSRTATIGMAIGLAAFIGWRGAELRDVGKVLAQFDPRPASAFAIAIGRSSICGIGQIIHAPACAPNEMDKVSARFAKDPGPVGQMFAAMGDEGTFRYRSHDGVLRDSAPAEMVAAEVKAKSCFTTDSYVVGQFGLHPVIPGPQGDDKFSIDRWLSSGDDAALAVVMSGGAPDAALAAYVTSRKERLRMVHAYFGQPGLDYGLQHFAGGNHPAAIAILQRRLADPAYVAALAPDARAEMQLLAQHPDAFIPCRAAAKPGA